MVILLIPNFKDTTSCEPSDWWDESETNLWEDWDKISEHQAISWQYCVNKRFSLEYRTSSVWLMVFLTSSCSTELHKEIEKKLEKLPNNQRGGVIYLYYLLTASFKMSRDVKKAIQTISAFGVIKVFPRSRAKMWRMLSCSSLVVASVLMLLACLVQIM